MATLEAPPGLGPPPPPGFTKPLYLKLGSAATVDSSGSDNGDISTGITTFGASDYVDPEPVELGANVATHFQSFLPASQRTPLKANACTFVPFSTAHGEFGDFGALGAPYFPADVQVEPWLSDTWPYWSDMPQEIIPPRSKSSKNKQKREDGTAKATKGVRKERRANEDSVKPSFPESSQDPAFISIQDILSIKGPVNKCEEVEARMTAPAEECRTRINGLDLALSKAAFTKNASKFRGKQKLSSYSTFDSDIEWSDSDFDDDN